MNALLEEVRRRVPIVSTDPLDLLATARDLWPRDTLALARGQLPDLPDLICWPETHEQTLSLLRWATRAGVPLVPYGAGSGVCGGASGRSGAVVVDLKRMRRLLETDRGRQVVTAEPGLLGQELEDRLERQGLATRHSPSSIWCSSVGGWAAARSAGQFSSYYGKFEDMVLALRVATPDGTRLTGMDCPVGEEDLGPLFQGSEGTLGIITRVSVRTVPLPRHRWLRAYAFPDLDSAWEAMRGLMQAELWPAVLRLYDPPDTKIGGRLASQSPAASWRRAGGAALKKLRGALSGHEALRRWQLGAPLSAPGLLNRLTQILGKRVLLVVGWEGEPELVRALRNAALPYLRAGSDLGAETGEAWYTNRHEISFKMAPVFMGGGFADTMEVATSWSRLGGLYHAVRDAIGRHAFVVAHFSHAYPEGCSIYFSFAGRGELERYDRTWEAGLEAARRAGGTVTHHHGVGQLKAQAATRELGHALRIYWARKAQLDPGGVMNPGRLFERTEVVGKGPPAPHGDGPVYDVKEHDLLAQADPAAEPAAIQQALARRGLGLRIVPDRPLGAWLRAWRIEAFERHEVPLFSLQARFSDGCAAKLGLAPRSAAGPDLRWGLLRDARPELVEVPLVRLDGPAHAVAINTSDPWGTARELLREGLRPLDRQADEDGNLLLSFRGDAAEALCQSVAASGLGAVAPCPETRGPRSPDLVPHPAGRDGATAHHRLTGRDPGSEPSHG